MARLTIANPGHRIVIERSGWLKDEYSLSVTSGWLADQRPFDQAKPVAS